MIHLHNLKENFYKTRLRVTAANLDAIGDDAWSPADQMEIRVTLNTDEALFKTVAWVYNDTIRTV